MSELDNLKENIISVKARVSKALAKANRNDEVTIVGASKTMPSHIIELVNEYDLLQVLGENKAQELRDKYRAEHKIKWHFIGAFQSNKIKYLAGRAILIESVDSLDIARELSRYAVSHTISFDILIQVNMGREPQKSGFLTKEVMTGLAEIVKLEGIHIKGLMAVMPIAPDDELITLYKELNALYITTKKVYPQFCYLSAGMTNDFELAIQYGGANIVRVGRAIFGDR